MFAIVTDFPNYPQWAADLKEVTVLDADADGTAHSVRYRAAAFGRSTTYVLAYDYSEAPPSSTGNRRRATSPRVSTASTCSSRRAEGTKVTYHLEVDLKFPLPGFIKQRAAGAHREHRAAPTPRPRRERRTPT